MSNLKYITNNSDSSNLTDFLFKGIDGCTSNQTNILNNSVPIEPANFVKNSTTSQKNNLSRLSSVSILLEEIYALELNTDSSNYGAASKIIEVVELLIRNEKFDFLDTLLLHVNYEKLTLYSLSSLVRFCYKARLNLMSFKFSYERACKRLIALDEKPEEVFFGLNDL